MVRTAFLGLVFALVSTTVAFAADTPTVQQVYDAAQAGRLNEAQQMIQQVLKEHPTSAKAHFVDAELLAKAGRAADARAELSKAEQLEPGLPFVEPQSVSELKARIDHTPTQPPAGHGSQGGFPWGWLFLGVGALAVIALVMRSMARPRGTLGYPTAYQPGFPPGGSSSATQAAPGMGSSGLGSSIVTGLATGAALGAGMVAGEELVRHFTEGGSASTNQNQPGGDSWETVSNDMGGNDFGITDKSSWDDSMADMSGGDDWT